MSKKTASLAAAGGAATSGAGILGAACAACCPACGGVGAAVVAALGAGAAGFLHRHHMAFIGAGGGLFLAGALLWLRGRRRGRGPGAGAAPPPEAARGPESLDSRPSAARPSCAGARDVDSGLRWPDVLGAWKARWGIGRMGYKIEPGLYSLNGPERDSPVFVTANYKMSFDRLGAALAGLRGWILVLDTKGINVWCAAGKGTFGTEELIGRVESSLLAGKVSHRTLIVPQLGAAGVRGVEVAARSGFKVVFGPVRAGDLPAFLRAGMKADPAMRRVRFDLRDRLVLSPMELVGWGRFILPLCVVLLLLGKPMAALALALGLLAGGVATPALLPWLPFRSFSAKGALAGAGAAAAGILAAPVFGVAAGGWGSGLSWSLAVASLSSVIALYFTGASTYTSLSGVRKELRWALPAQMTGLLAAGAHWLVQGNLR